MTSISQEGLLSADQLIADYSLAPHPEGGYFSRVFTSAQALGGEPDARHLAGSIYFLLKGKDISHFHQIDCEELWYYHAGCGLTLHLITTDGKYQKLRLGFGKDASPMLVIPKDAIFAAENIEADSYTFMSCMTTPQFHFAGFRLVAASELKGYSLSEKLFCTLPE